MDLTLIVAVLAATILVAVLIPICRSQGQSAWWSLLGVAGMLVFSVAVLVVFAWKPRRVDGATNLNVLYASGEITEEEYLRAVTADGRPA